MTIPSLLMLALASHADAGNLQAPVAPIVRAQPGPSSSVLSSRQEQGAVAERKPGGPVCAIRVMKVDPAFDAGILHGGPQRRLDRIVRDDVAGCAR